MFDYYPMARATSKLGGNAYIYDLKQIDENVGAVPDYPLIQRQLETVNRGLRTKRFGTRPTAELRFEIPHSNTQNSLARWYEASPELLISRNDFDNGGVSAAPWQRFNAVVITPMAAIGPTGLMSADKIEDAASGLISFMKQRPGGALPTPAPKTYLMGIFAKSDTPQDFSFGVSNDTSESNIVKRTAGPYWRRYFAQATFDDGLGSSVNAYIYPAGASGPSSAQGYIYAAESTLKEIVPKPGTDEEILQDLWTKLGIQGDDWSVEISLDGGLVWREVTMQDHSKTLLQDKTVGHAERFLLEATKSTKQVSAVFDGAW